MCIAIVLVLCGMMMHFAMRERTCRSRDRGCSGKHHCEDAGDEGAAHDSTYSRPPRGANNNSRSERYNAPSFPRSSNRNRHSLLGPHVGRRAHDVEEERAHLVADGGHGAREIVVNNIGG